ncbi:IS200/IS605 family transposase [Paraburkholderia megapolitana]|uniref:IS200/IS605 family transposase n=1 Tax=Paraburkholderia megapolitana TaxID=420953 RepID=UPI0038BCD76F
MECGPVHGVQEASHCAWQIHYHVVFPVKYLKAPLDEEVVRTITETAQAISERHDIEFEQIGCNGDHIHLLYSAHPKVAPGQIVRVFKSITAREIFRCKPGVKKALWGGEFWTDGYFVAMVGEGRN